MMRAVLYLGLLAVLTPGGVRGVPFEVNSRETCPTMFSIDSGTLSNIARGDTGAPCTGYVRLEISGSSRRVCGDEDTFYNYAAQRLCYTLGVNMYRNTTTFDDETRQMMLYECFVYREQFVESVGKDSSIDIWDTNALFDPEHAKGCENNQDDPDIYDCFDNCHFTSAPVDGDEDDCPTYEPYFAVGCADINECENGVRDHCRGPFRTSCTIRRACGNNTACSNIIGSYQCDCKTGYEAKNGDPDLDPYDLNIGCKDIDECEADTAVCGHAGQCINTPGSYLCICPTRQLWDDDAKTCTGPVCGSPPVDPNAARNATDSLPGEAVLFNCEDGFLAPDGTKSYTSVCTGGEWFHNGYCTDVNECSASTCDPHADCYNGPGFAECRCQPGFTGDGLTCTRVPCGPLPEVPHSSASNLIFHPDGSHALFEDAVTFTCDSGYQVSIQNMPYQLLDFYGYNPTTSFKLTCDTRGHWTPNPTPRCLPVFCGDPGVLPNSDRAGSGFLYQQEVTYTCQDGYRAGTKGGTTFTRTCQQDGHWSPGSKCQDIDECSDLAGVCGAEGKYCINTEGSYLCSCVPWYQADINDNRCVEWAGLVDFPDYQPCHIMESLGLCRNGDCEVNNGKSHCQCKPGYYGIACDQPVMGPALIVAVVGMVLLVILMLILCLYCRCHLHRPTAVVDVAPPYAAPYPAKANLCGPVSRWGYNLCGREAGY